MRTVRSFTLCVAGLALIAAASACTSGEASDAGASGAAGQPGTGGLVGTGGDSGVGGTAGAGGVAGTGGDAGMVATPPAPPASYTVPVGAISVSTIAELLTQLQSSTAADIVLEDGTYSNPTPVTFSAGHRLWARTLGGATLDFGLVAGGNSGSGGQELHGLRFDLTSADKGFQSSAINTWGTGKNVVIADCWLSGNLALAGGVIARQPDGLRIQRVVIDGFTDAGIFFQYPQPDLTTNPAVSVLVEDATITRVRRATPGSSDGTAEAGIWAGTACTVRRAKISDAGWSGVETVGNVNDSLFEDVDIADVAGTVPSSGAPEGTGIYLEHFTRRTVFRRVVTKNVRVGMASEWADPAWTNPVVGESRAGGHYNTLEDSTISSSCDGVSLDEGTDHMTVRTTRFSEQRRAAIRDYLGAGNSYAGTGNDYTGILPGAVPVSTDHYSSNPCPP